jgi:hypothetical protein
MRIEVVMFGVTEAPEVSALSAEILVDHEEDLGLSHARGLAHISARVRKAPFNAARNGSR